MTLETTAPETAQEAPTKEIGVGLTDVLNVSQMAKVSGFSRPVIRRAIIDGEMNSFEYARQVCVLRTEYVRWLNTLVTTHAV